MGMTNEDAKKMLEAKLKCFIAETSGTNHDCNMRLCEGCALNYEQGNMGEQKQALDMAIKALEQQPRWIPVSERLPEEHKEVLTCGLGGYIEIQSFEDSYDGYWENQNGDWSDLDEVIAWMPLPPSYQGE